GPDPADSRDPSWIRSWKRARLYAEPTAALILLGFGFAAAVGTFWSLYRDWGTFSLFLFHVRTVDILGGLSLLWPVSLLGLVFLIWSLCHMRRADLFVKHIGRLIKDEGAESLGLTDSLPGVRAEVSGVVKAIREQGMGGPYLVVWAFVLILGT